MRKGGQKENGDEKRPFFGLGCYRRELGHKFELPPMKIRRSCEMILTQIHVSRSLEVKGTHAMRSLQSILIPQRKQLHSSMIKCFTTWKEFLKTNLEDLSEAEDTLFKFDLTTAESGFDKWLCIASEPHQLSLAKVEGNQDPVILHSFLTVQGTRKEIGLKHVKNVVLCGMSRKVQVASVDVEELFGESEFPSLSLPVVFKLDSIEAVQNMATKSKRKTSNPRTKVPSCILLPKHIALAFLETGTAAGSFLPKRQ